MIRKITTAFTLTLLLFFAALPGTASGRTTHEVFFKHTDYELHVYKIFGEQKGKTLLIIGGIQGDEPGGYLAADLYVDIGLQKGNMILVPRANFLSIIKNKRAINGDMNRRFNNNAEAKKTTYEDEIVDILEGLIQESDILLNLHEGSGFYSPKYVNRMINPRRYGQSIIADADVYKKEDGGSVYLGEIARKVIEKVNPLIKNKKHHFKFNNHDTFSHKTKHAEQRSSATFYALAHHEIPAFGIETSKAIRDLELKVNYQTKVINAFMDVFDIVPISPYVKIVPPTLHYLGIKINGEAFLVKNGSKVKVKKGSAVKVFNIDAVSKRGLSVDIEGYGTFNDFNKNFTIDKSARVVVMKDRFRCGEVFLDTKADKKLNIDIKYLIVELNGVSHVIKPNEYLSAVKGDMLKVVDVVAEGTSSDELKVNVRGFIPDKKANNNSNDKGYDINTAKDLQKRYSKRARGNIYRIDIRHNDRQLAKMYLKLSVPKMDYIVVKQKNGKGKKWYSRGDVIYVKPDEVIEVVDVKTNVKDNKGIAVSLNGKTLHKLDQKGRIILKVSDLISKNGKQKKKHYLGIVRENISLGKTTIKISESYAFKGK